MFKESSCPQSGLIDFPSPLQVRLSDIVWLKLHFEAGFGGIDSIKVYQGCEESMNDNRSRQHLQINDQPRLLI